MVTLEFLITSLIVVLIPGPGVVLTVSSGITHGRRASVFTAIGCTAGIVPHLLATVLGLAAVLHSSAVAFQVLKFAGVAYLLYIAVATWRDKSAFALEGDLPSGADADAGDSEGGADGGAAVASVASPGRGPSARRAMGLMTKAFLVNILNPKLTIFFLAFLPQFVEPNAASPLAQLLLLSGIFMAMTFAVFVVYGFLAHAFRKAVIESPRVQSWLRRSFAAAFAGLGLNLALSDR
jgi:threonine/homoserine/homoserine lactone efflux protein